MSDAGETDVLRLIAGRHCKRQFLDKPVPRDLVARTLAAAANAPSSKNTQPWQVAVLTDSARDALSAAMCAKFDRGVFEKPDYASFPDPMPDDYLQRARACGFNLFALKGVDRRDRRQRRAHERENYVFFGAPMVMIFHLPEDSGPGGFLDMGFFMQNVMLGLQAGGLGTCPQASLLRYSDTIRATLGLDGRWIVSGLSVGYIDEAAEVNTYVPERLPLDEYVRWLDAIPGDDLA